MAKDSLLIRLSLSPPSPPKNNRHFACYFRSVLSGSRLRNRRSRIEIETRGTRAKSIVFLFLSNTQRVRLGQSVVRMAETRKVISYRLVASVIFRARQIDLFCTTQGSFKVENSVHRVVYRLHSKLLRCRRVFEEKKTVRFIVYEEFIFSAGTEIFLAPVPSCLSIPANLYTSKFCLSTASFPRLKSAVVLSFFA